MPQPTSSVPPYLVASRPDADLFVEHPYSAKNPKDKKLNKIELCESQGWAKQQWMTVFVPLSLVESDGVALFSKLAASFRGRSVHVLVMGSGLKAADLPPNVRVVAEDEELFHKALAGADMLVLPGTPQPAFIAQTLAWRYGTVPVLPRAHAYNGEADDYDPVLESGNAFLFDDGDVWSLHAALVRAQETFRLPYDWRGIQRTGYELGGR